jgi:N4-gp56 family major capsid protein
MSNFLKPTVIVSTALGLLVRELTLPRLVWRDPVGDFAGAFNDTISIRLPAYVNARSRVLRSGSARTQDALFERKVDLTLDTDVYLDVPITDELLTLDIANFGTQVLNPMMEGVGRTIEDKLTAAIEAATYLHTIAFNSATQTPYLDVAVPARTLLNQGRVPMAGRAIICGSELEAAFLSDPQFIRADHIGTTAEATVREAQIGRVAGFDVYSSPALLPTEGYAFHQTAYALSTRAPVVPAGAPYGATNTYGGFALRTVRVFDPDAVQDRLVMDAWLGAAVVTDDGHFDADPAAGGRFVPVTDPSTPITGHANAWENDLSRVVRAVKITVS